MTRRKSTLTILAVGTALAAAGWWSYQKTMPLLAARRTHDAFARQDVETVLAESSGLVATPDRDGEILAALAVRCGVLNHLNRKEECLLLLDQRLLQGDAMAWVPSELLPAWFNHAVAQGRRADAAVVAQRWLKQNPANPFAAHWLFSLRIGGEDVSQILQESLSWADGLSPDDALQFRLRVVYEMIGMHDGASALAALGNTPPIASDSSLHDRWWAMRIAAAADSGNQPLAAAVRDEWLANGGGATARARYAVEISYSSIKDPAYNGWIAPLKMSFDEIDQVSDIELRRTLTARLLGHLVIEEERELLAIYLERAKVLDPTFVDNEDELRRAIQAGSANVGERPVVRFLVDKPVADASLWISPDVDERPDGVWERVALGPNGSGSVQRSHTPTPYRWVYRSETETFGSGTVWPSAIDTGSPVDVQVDSTPLVRRPTAVLRPQPTQDGNRRIWVVVLDCADWRLTSYLRQRGELPTLHALIEQGWRAGLLQDPPYTAAAMEALTEPALRRSASFPNSIHQVGLELAGLSSVGSNPFAGLKFILPEVGDLFATLGAGDTRVGNMLFAHGNVKAGRNAAVTGPNGRVSNLEVGAVHRPPSAEDEAHFPEITGGLPPSKTITDGMDSTAAQLDAVVRQIGANNVDVLLYRLEALDLVTHGYFADIAATKQDNGAGQLFTFYRYIDYRLAEIANAIDNDDLLIVMSDHGIKTSMEHHPVAMFIAWGNGVPQGRTTGYPELRGVAHVIAGLRGVSTNWPDTQILPWTDAWREGRTPSGVGVPYTAEVQP